MKAKLKKLLMIAVAMMTMGCLVAGNVVMATPIDDGIERAQKSTGMKKSDTKDADSVVKTVISTLIWAVGILATIMIIIGGIMYTTSAGDPGKIKRAKDTIMYGIVGLVIAVLAYVIVNFVLRTVL